MNTFYKNAHTAFLHQLLHVLDAPEIEIRGNKVREIVGESLVIRYPRERCYLLLHRNDSIFAKIAETLWVLNGRNDLEFLSYYLPRAIDFSDDGETWRAGYGSRLRHYHNSWDSNGSYLNLGVDQVQEIYKLLNKDPNTRRAVASIFDPELDYVESKDIPCNNWMQFMIREGKLEMFVAQRSSDILWGFSGINTFEWSVLQELMASWLNVGVGNLHYFISSLHLYDRHYDRALKIVNSNYNKNHLCLYPYIFQDSYSIITTNLSPKITSKFEDFAGIMDTIFSVEEKARLLSPSDISNTIIAKEHKILLEDPFFNECLIMMLIYITLKKRSLYDVKIDIIPTLNILLSLLSEDDFKICAIEYISRYIPYILQYLPPTHSTDIVKQFMALG